ncbi:hypothetical protein VP01_5056g1 [Puccinia sorghi]|uniref:Uncharacterized protein n=1 Tax=Puccinia sorghi TaxID=27349 RepID=A0A0L6ULJ0_9BASI|nr:hypothetical protein VP01_5056g1 [Puccinia sorghi]
MNRPLVVAGAGSGLFLERRKFLSGEWVFWSEVDCRMRSHPLFPQMDLNQVFLSSATSFQSLSPFLFFLSSCVSSPLFHFWLLHSKSHYSRITSNSTSNLKRNFNIKSQSISIKISRYQSVLNLVRMKYSHSIFFSFTRPKVKAMRTHCLAWYKGAPLYLTRQCVHVAFVFGLSCIVRSFFQILTEKTVMALEKKLCSFGKKKILEAVYGFLVHSVEVENKFGETSQVAYMHLSKLLLLVLLIYSSCLSRYINHSGYDLSVFASLSIFSFSDCPFLFSSADIYIYIYIYFNEVVSKISRMGVKIFPKWNIDVKIGSPFTAKKNLLNCLQLTSRKSQEASVVSPTFLSELFNQSLMHIHCVKTSTHANRRNLDDSLAGACCMSTAGS